MVKIYAYILTVLFIANLYANTTNTNPQPTNATNASASSSSQPDTAVSQTNVVVENDGITKWLIDNQDSIEALIKETATKTTTKWVEENTAEENNAEENAPNSSTDENTNSSSENKADKPTNTPASPPSKIIKHKVKSGDTLFSLAKLYNTTVVEIENLNGVKALDLKANSTISIKTNTVTANVNPNAVLSNNNSGTANAKPTTPATKPKQLQDYSKLLPKYKYYRVVSGDTLDLIAKKNNMSKAELIELNELEKNNTLYVNAILKVKSNYTVKHPEKEQTFAWPVVGRLLRSYGPQSSGIVNEGINIYANYGTPIKAALDGIVTYVGSGIKGFGNLILIQHQNSYITAYANLGSVLVKKGDIVKQNDIIAKAGKSGGVSTPQVHFEIRKDIKPLDPLNYLDSYN